MFRPITLIAICASLINVATSYLSVNPNATHPDFPGQCYDRNLKLAVKVGDEFQVPDMCERGTCGSDFTLHYAGCGVVGTKPPCVIVPGDNSKPYPCCCRSIKCGESILTPGCRATTETDAKKDVPKGTEATVDASKKGNQKVEEPKNGKTKSK